MNDNRACENTDVELWRGPDEGNGDYYADSIHMTKGGGLGINCGGMVIVKPVRTWHALARQATEMGERLVKATKLIEEDNDAMVKLIEAEADVLRLHREKCDFYQRAIDAEIERDQLRAKLKPFIEADWYTTGFGTFSGNVSKEALDIAKSLAPLPEKTAADAPALYSAEEASAWADGYNASHSR